jgi:hypothetical protein
VNLPDITSQVYEMATLNQSAATKGPSVGVQSSVNPTSETALVSGHPDLPTGGHEPDDESDHVGWSKSVAGGLYLLGFAQDDCDATPSSPPLGWYRGPLSRALSGRHTLTY